jgi:lipoprotein-anchoring transpeptidase ErfK/SrfK
MPQHTAPSQQASPERPSRRPLLIWSIVGVVAVVAVVVGLTTFLGPGSDTPAGGSSNAVADGATDSAGEVLLASTTHTTIDAAPADQQADEGTDGLVVHPIRETPVHESPGGRAIARMETTQLGDTWLPVIAEQPGWVQVLLPSKPNGSTGWLRADDLERARTPYVIEVHLGSMTLELIHDGEVVEEWTVGIGKESAPTPTGRTFLLGAFTDENQDYSPVILPLGAHSPTHDTFGGGPGTVAIHTWPTDDVYGTASSDGCIRVPQDALDQLSEVPLGTLVMIDEE